MVGSERDVRSVVENDPAWSVVAGAAGIACGAIVHGEWITALDRFRLGLGDDRRIELVLGAIPDPGVTVQRFHAMSITGMGLADLAQGIRAG